MGVLTSKPFSRRHAFAVVLLAYASLHGLWTVFHWGGAEVVARVAGSPLVLPSLAATTLAFRRAQREPLGNVRAGWQLFAVALTLYSLGMVVWAYYTVSGRGIPFPSLADPLFLAFPWLFLGSLMLLVSSHLTQLERSRALLNTAVMLGAAGLVQWTVLLRHTVALDAASPLATAAGLLYPLGDLLMVGGLIFSGLQALRHLTQPFLLPMMGGAALFVVGNIIYALQISAGTYHAGSPLDITWVLGLAFFAIAALTSGQLPAPDAAARSDNPWSGRVANALIGILLAAALAALVRLVVNSGNRVDDGVVVGISLVLIATAAFLRQRLEFHENARLTHELQEVNRSLEARVEVAVGDLETRNRELQVQTQALRRSNEAITLRTREVTLLNELGDLLQVCLTFEEAFAVISRITPRFFPDATGALYLTSASRNVVELSASWGGEKHEQALAPEDCWALRRGRDHLVTEAGTAPHCKHLLNHPPASYLCVPLVAQGEAIGLFHLSSLGSSAPWQDGPGQRLARTVADAVALALSNLRLRETLRHQSIRDPLTGLYNRRYLEETLERELRRAARGDTPIGLVVFDIDHFKRFNDTFGHEAGDAVLRELGAVIKGHLRGGDIACRYGGEEFVLVIPGASQEATRFRAEELREAARGLRLSLRGQPIGAVSLSLGVAAFPDHGDSGEILIRAADAALYRAKQGGRDRVIIA